jgi:hypothetical protein
VKVVTGSKIFEPVTLFLIENDNLRLKLETWLITASVYESKYKGYDNIERNTAFNGNFSFNALFGYEWKITDCKSLSININPYSYKINIAVYRKLTTFAG